jgi:hypothetical protein
VRSSNLFALFDCIIDPESGAYLSEDYSFCLRWRRIGGEIWIDAASKLNHCGPYEFVGDHASRFYGLTRTGLTRTGLTRTELTEAPSISASNETLTDIAHSSIS